MHLGIASDHGGFHLKQALVERLRQSGHTVRDFGAVEFLPDDDFPDYVVPLSRAVAGGEVERGIALCGSGVGACVAANKIRGVRAALVHEHFSARQGVEDDAMNLLCLGGQVLGPAVAWELLEAFVQARFREEPRFLRRLEKIAALER